MKQIIRKASVVITIGLLCSQLALQGCRDDDETNPQEIRLQELSQTWVLGTVTNDGNDVTSQFTGFTLTIDQFSFTTQNGGNTWPDSGTYSFLENDLDLILRLDAVEINVVSLSAEALTITFQISQLNGRKQGVTGNFEFQLINQN
ncbi:MAG: hypothetical protein AAF901_01780 [Bacteroidota bacterium]